MLIQLKFDGAVKESKLGTDMGVAVAVFVDGVYEEALSTYKFFAGDEFSSSNVAEWLGCVEAFRLAVEYKQEGDVIEVYSDSEVITKQFNGEFEIRKEHFKQYYKQAIKDYNKLGSWGLKITWIPREQNKEADRLSKIAINTWKDGKVKKNKSSVQKVG